MNNSCKIEELKTIQNSLISALSSEINKGLECVNTKEASEVIDMIKDISKTEKNYYESCYYKEVIEAMEKQDKNNEYSNNMTYKSYIDKEPYINEYLKNPSFMENRRMGYHPSESEINHTQESSDKKQLDKYGKSYNEYQIAKNNYMNSRSINDKQEMDKKALEHINDAITCVKNMWREADPELKKHMKTNFSNLLAEMT